MSRIEIFGQLISRRALWETRYGNRMSWNLSNLSSRTYSDGEDGKSDKSRKPLKKDGDELKSHSDKSERDNNPAKKKLNDLLKSIVKDSAAIQNAAAMKSGKPTEKKVNMQLAGSSRKTNLEKEIEKEKAAAPGPKEKKILHKDSIPTEGSESLSPELVKAVKTVADALGGDPEATETELVHKLKTQTGKLNLSELFVGMKIDRTEKQDSSGVAPISSGLGESRAQYVRKQLRDQPERPRPSYQPRQWQGQGDRDRDRGRDRDRDRQQPRPAYQYSQVGLFQSKPLGIFSVKPSAQPPPDVPTLKTWDTIHQKELKLQVTHPPANGFEEMILWTETGKLWKFPIDNEQDFGEEANVGFQDHVFLEPHLDPWCPKKGPIRHFMEVVCTALGKNSYLTAKEKRECVEWYHSYFKSKAEIIKETGAGTIQ